jgi:hypothetical protein
VNTYPPVTGPDPTADQALAALMAQLHERLHGAVCCTLVYGSCLRSGDIYDGLLDLYLICDSYRTAYNGGLLGACNWLLPPNVFYAQQEAPGADGNGRTLRSKVTVISLRDFERGCSTAWFESYIWGRFAQPTFILHARDQQVRSRVEASLIGAAATLLRNTLPALPSQGSLETLWERSLDLSYATELRTERAGRAGELVEASREFYTALTHRLAAGSDLPMALFEQDGRWRYRTEIGGTRRRLARVSWLLRRVQGKLLSIARLVKALFTFEGGLDYIAWKLERHSGEKITIPDKVRRAPLIHMWPFFWGLYRRGIFK